MSDLSTAGPFDRAFAINRRGEIVGHQNLQVLLWRDRELIPVPLSGAWDVNDRGVVVGFVQHESAAVAATWHDGIVTEPPRAGRELQHRPRHQPPRRRRRRDGGGRRRRAGVPLGRR